MHTSRFKPEIFMYNFHNLFFAADSLVTVEVPGKSDTSPPTHIRKRSVGIIDMGGGSLQIAMEVPKSVRFTSPQVIISIKPFLIVTIVYRIFQYFFSYCI